MRNDYSDLSALEREFEYEMEGASGEDTEMEFESLADDNEFEENFEFETDDELEGPDDEFEENYEFEGDDDRAYEFVERFMEISGRQFETSYEVDAAMNEVLDDIEREYFFGAIKRGLKKLSKNKLLRSLAKKGMTLGVNKFFPGLQGALQLARGNVKGALLNFGKQALGSVVPGGAVMLDAVKQIGLQPGGDGEAPERETWENFVDLSREAYEHLADNLTSGAHLPGEATRLANNAVQHAIAKARRRTAPRRAMGARRRPHGRVVQLRVAPGERVKLVLIGG